MKEFAFDTVAPVSDVTTMVARPTAPLGARTTMEELLWESVSRTCAPPTVTLATPVPPPKRPVPARVMRVPICPRLGVTVAMEPGAKYEKALVLLTMAPVSAVRMTSPVVGTSCCAARTTTWAAEKDSMACTSTPARVTETMLVPLPRRCVPWMVTRVPSCPEVGATVAMAPSTE